MSVLLTRLAALLTSPWLQGDKDMISSVLILEGLLPLNHWHKCLNSLLMTDSIVLSFLLENIRLVPPVKWWMIGLDTRIDRH